jgi:hypothetical protein
MTEPDHVEPPTESIRRFAVRRADDDVDSLVDAVMDAIDRDARIVDLSHHDRRGDTIELRVAGKTRRNTS